MVVKYLLLWAYMIIKYPKWYIIYDCLISHIVFHIWLPNISYRLSYMIPFFIFRTKPANIMLLNQSAIDAVSCITSMLTDLINNLQMSSASGFLLELFCSAWLSTYTMWACVTSSSYNLVLITMERYLAITDPMGYDREQVMRRLPWVICVAWLSGMGDVFKQ